MLLKKKGAGIENVFRSHTGRYSLSVNYSSGQLLLLLSRAEHGAGSHYLPYGKPAGKEHQPGKPLIGLECRELCQALPLFGPFFWLMGRRPAARMRRGGLLRQSFLNLGVFNAQCKQMRLFCLRQSPKLGNHQYARCGLVQLYRTEQPRQLLARGLVSRPNRRPGIGPGSQPFGKGRGTAVNQCGHQLSKNSPCIICAPAAEYYPLPRE